MKTWSMILLTIKKKFTIFVGLNLLTRALLEKHFARTRSMHQVQNKVNKDSIKKKTLRVSSRIYGVLFITEE